MKNKKDILLDTSLKSEKLPVKCRFWGHKIGELNDSHFVVCERCGSHSYYDSGLISNTWNESAILMRPFWYIQSKFNQAKLYLKYWYFPDDLPF